MLLAARGGGRASAAPPPPTAAARKLFDGISAPPTPPYESRPLSPASSGTLSRSLAARSGHVSGPPPADCAASAAAS